MIPKIVVYYVRAASERRPGEKIAKAAFVNTSDALIFWEALSEKRKRHLTMETIEGEQVVEIAHTGFYDDLGGHYGHAYAITNSNPIPPRELDRQSAERSGWEFVKVMDRR